MKLLDVGKERKGVEVLKFMTVATFAWVSELLIKEEISSKPSEVFQSLTVLQ